VDIAGVELACPACRCELARGGTNGAAADDDGELRCVGCARTYPIILGIPDLRLQPDPYIGLEEDRAKARMLADACRELSFAESIELYYRLTTVVPPFQAKRFARSLMAAADRAADLLDVTRVEADVRDGALLDLGCGTAPLLFAAQRRGIRAVGADIALRWLVMARKRLEEAGFDAALVCAGAEALPFRAARFDAVVAESTIEHLYDQRAAVEECHRVSCDDARIILTTPNRHSLGPDPHTGLPAGGMLPDRVTAAYVRRKGGIAPRRRLLNQRDLRALLVHAGYDDVSITAPDVPSSQRNGFGALGRTAIDTYHFAKRVPGGDAVIRAIGPLLLASARKPATASAHT
jgi:SAM-dependent methyltransferase